MLEYSTKRREDLSPEAQSRIADFEIRYGRVLTRGEFAARVARAKDARV